MWPDNKRKKGQKALLFLQGIKATDITDPVRASLAERPARRPYCQLLLDALDGGL